MEERDASASPRVDVLADPYGIPVRVGRLVHMLTFTSDTAPLVVGEEGSEDTALTISACSGRRGCAENETNIVVGPVTRTVVSDGTVASARPGRHAYVLLLVKVDR